MRPYYNRCAPLFLSVAQLQRRRPSSTNLPPRHSRLHYTSFMQKTFTGNLRRGGGTLGGVLPKIAGEQLRMLHVRSSWSAHLYNLDFNFSRREETLSVSDKPALFEHQRTHTQPNASSFSAPSASFYSKKRAFFFTTNHQRRRRRLSECSL